MILRKKTGGERQGWLRARSGLPIGAKRIMVSTRAIPDGRAERRSGEDVDASDDSSTDKENHARRHAAVVSQLSASTTASAAARAKELEQHPGSLPRIGERIEVYWPAESSYYAGLVVGYNDNRCRVAYEDGDVENLDLGREKWSYVKSTPAPKSGSKKRSGGSPGGAGGIVKCQKRARAEKVLYAAVARCYPGPAPVRVRAAADLLAAALADERVLTKITETKYSRASLPGNLRTAVRAAFDDVRMQRYQSDVARALAVLLTALDHLRKKYHRS